MNKVLPSLALTLAVAASSASAQVTTVPLPHQNLAPALNGIAASLNATAASAPDQEASGAEVNTAAQETAAKILGGAVVASGLLLFGLVARDRMRSPS